MRESYNLRLREGRRAAWRGVWLMGLGFRLTGNWVLETREQALALENAARDLLVHINDCACSYTIWADRLDQLVYDRRRNHEGRNAASRSR